MNLGSKTLLSVLSNLVYLRVAYIWSCSDGTRHEWCSTKLSRNVRGTLIYGWRRAEKTGDELSVQLCFFYINFLQYWFSSLFIMNILMCEKWSNAYLLHIYSPLLIDAPFRTFFWMFLLCLKHWRYVINANITKTNSIQKFIFVCRNVFTRLSSEERSYYTHHLLTRVLWRNWDFNLVRLKDPLTYVKLDLCFQHDQKPWIRFKLIIFFHNLNLLTKFTNFVFKFDNSSHIWF